MCSKIYWYNSDFKQPPQQALRRNYENIQDIFFSFVIFILWNIQDFPDYWNLIHHSKNLLVIININKIYIYINYVKINKKLKLLHNRQYKERNANIAKFIITVLWKKNKKLIHKINRNHRWIIFLKSRTSCASGLWSSKTT